MTRILAAAALLIAAGCANQGTTSAAEAAAPAAGSAVADLADAKGTRVGRAVGTEHGGMIHLSVEARSLPPGVHGIHVHTVGRCDAPDFTTAGSHWNPAGKQHGTENPQGPHAGDMPNLTIGADGRGSLTFMLPSGTLDGMLDADGAALVIHAAADDLKTDPSGNSGARLACGVFRRG
ncbi:superoxide dismutase family protein [Sphingomonas cannabina]|uniref:superoxide dismutase family protein n=1 Tax=Sphingomonas cannabina TaxID=2899123 RepID=UPI003872CDE7